MYSLFPLNLQVISVLFFFFFLVLDFEKHMPRWLLMPLCPTTVSEWLAKTFGQDKAGRYYSIEKIV